MEVDIVEVQEQITKIYAENLLDKKTVKTKAADYLYSKQQESKFTVEHHQEIGIIITNVEDASENLPNILLKKPADATAEKDLKNCLQYLAKLNDRIHSTQSRKGRSIDYLKHRLSYSIQLIKQSPNLYTSWNETLRNHFDYVNSVLGNWNYYISFDREYVVQNKQHRKLLKKIARKIEIPFEKNEVRGNNPYARLIYNFLRIQDVPGLFGEASRTDSKDCANSYVFIHLINNEILLNQSKDSCLDEYKSFVSENKLKESSIKQRRMLIYSIDKLDKLLVSPDLRAWWSDIELLADNDLILSDLDVKKITILLEKIKNHIVDFRDKLINGIGQIRILKQGNTKVLIISEDNQGKIAEKMQDISEKLISVEGTASKIKKDTEKLIDDSQEIIEITSETGKNTSEIKSLLSFYIKETKKVEHPYFCTLKPPRKIHDTSQRLFSSDYHLQLYCQHTEGIHPSGIPYIINIPKEPLAKLAPYYNLMLGSIQNIAHLIVPVGYHQLKEQFGSQKQNLHAFRDTIKALRPIDVGTTLRQYEPGEVDDAYLETFKDLLDKMKDNEPWTKHLKKVIYDKRVLWVCHEHATWDRYS